MNDKFEQARQLMRDAVAEDFIALTGQGHRTPAVNITKLAGSDSRTAYNENRSLYWAVSQLAKMSAVLRQMDNCDPNLRGYNR